MKQVDKSWNEYIKYQKSKGLNTQQIREDLIKNNYSKDIVDEEIKRYETRQDNKKRTIIASVLLIVVCLLLFKPTLTGFVTSDNNQLQTLAYSSNITIDFTQEVGTVNDYFYGVNTHGTWGSVGSMIDTSDDGVSDTLSDYSWHRTKMQEAGINYIRADMNLNYLMFGIINKDAEKWGQDSTTISSGTNSVSNYPTGWDFEIVGAGSIGTISKSTDAHSGLYSVNITNTGTGSAFSNLDMMLPATYVYNLSVWVKSSYNISISLQRKDTWTNACRTASSGNNTWELLSCVATITDDVSQGWRIVIATNQGENLLWDDLNLQQNSVDYENIPDLSKQKDLVQWAHDNNMKVLFIASYIPDYLANITSDCISDTKTCSPLNATEWGDNVVKYITEVTDGGTNADSVEIEIWNEPDLEYFWLSDVGRTDAKRAQLFGQLYSATYDAIKAQYPNMQVGGPAVTGQDSDSELILRNIIENYSFDFISYHKYLGQGGSPYYDISLSSDLSWIQSICSDYSKSCPRILLDEWNVWDSSIKVNNESYWKMQLSLAYSTLLDNYPENISTAEYQWSETKSYNYAAVYPEYPQRWSMVSEPQLDNEVYASYNVTKDFSTYHGPGSTIIESTSTDSNIVAVASTYGSNSYLTLINKNVAPTNITIGIVGQEFNTLQDVKTGLNYSLNDSISIDGYAVDHYELLNVTVNISNSPPNITVTLSNELNCSTTATDADNDTITTTIEWYYNGTFNRTVNATSDVQSNMTGEHYCKARAYDQLNYSGWITSNTITINATINETIEQPVVNKPSSGGGGGSSYVPVEVNTTVNKTSTEVIVENNTEDNTTINTSQNTIDVPIEETTKIEEQPIEPIIEEPTTVINKYWIYFALFGLLFIISLFFIKKGVPIREDLTTYIKKLLDQGYEYKSIRRVLSKHYKQSEIDNHFHVLRRNNINPSKIQKEPKPFTKEVQDYIEKQKAVGYTEKEIMKVLKLQGYRH